MKKALAFIMFLTAALLFLPSQEARADRYTHYPGLPGDGPFSPTCVCPAWPYYACGCAIQTQGPE
jgi:hypothetical protein